MQDGARYEWRQLNDHAQIAIRDGRGVAIVYTSGATYGVDERAWEFWWLLVDTPDEPEVLFGVGEGVVEGWSRARQWVELELSRRFNEQ